MQLYVFVDEAGVPPCHDDDDVFVAGAYATIASNAPVLAQRPSAMPQIQWVLSQLCALNAVPSIALIRSRDGFMAKWGEKAMLMRGMAEARRRELGHEFMPAVGIKPRNWLWSYCVNTAVARAIVGAIGDPPCDFTSINLCIDRYSLRREQKSQIAAIYQNAGRRIASLVMQAAQTARAGRTEWLQWLERAAPQTADVNLMWFEEGQRSVTPMSLAHRLASGSFAEQRRGATLGRPLANALIAAGYRDVVFDMTHIAENPLNESAMLRWAEDLGAIVGEHN